MTPGWKTSECWHAMLAQAMAFFTLIGIVSKADSTTLEGSISNIITAAFVIITNGIVVVNYMKHRFSLKALQNDQDDTVRYTTTPAKPLLILIALLAVSSQAMAQCQCGPMCPCPTRPSPLATHPSQYPTFAEPEAWVPQKELTESLPWRQQMAQKIAQHEAAIAAIKNVPVPVPPATPAAPQIIYITPPAAASPAPLPIAMAPYQTFPIQGAPLQTFPIQGAPLQQFPIQGAPLQSFPIQGQPKQTFPIQGAPLQSFPMAPQGQIQQMPIAPPTPIQQLPVAPPTQPGATPGPLQQLPIAPPAPPQPLPIAPQASPTGPQQYSREYSLYQPN